MSRLVPIVAASSGAFISHNSGHSTVVSRRYNSHNNKGDITSDDQKKTNDADKKKKPAPTAWSSVSLPEGLSEAVASAASTTASAAASVGSVAASTAGSAAQGAASSVANSATSYWASTPTKKAGEGQKDADRTKEGSGADDKGSENAEKNEALETTRKKESPAEDTKQSSWWPSSSPAEPPKKLSFWQRLGQRPTQEAEKAAWKSFASDAPMALGSVLLGLGTGKIPFASTAIWALLKSSMARSGLWYVTKFVGRQMLGRPYATGTLFSGLVAFYWVAAPIAAIVSSVVCFGILSLMFLPRSVSTAVFSGLGNSFLVVSSVTGGGGGGGGGFFTTIGKLFWFGVVIAAAANTVFCWHFYIENGKLRAQIEGLGVPIQVDVQRKKEEEEREKLRAQHGGSNNKVVAVAWSAVDWMQVWWRSVSSFFGSANPGV